MLNEAQLQHLVFINTLGMTSLVQTIMEASYLFIGPTHVWATSAQTGITRKIAKESFAFIQGTGLEMMLQHYCIDLDADLLRNGFYSAVGQRKYIQ